MFDGKLTLDDALGAPIDLSTEPGFYRPCLRIVWRRVNNEYKAVGWLYTVESKEGIVATFKTPIKAMAKARTMNKTPAVSLPVIVRMRAIEPDGVALPHEILAEARFYNDEKIPGESFVLGQALGLTTRRP